MTPAEANGAIEAARFNRTVEAANIDRSAWLVGSYNMMAFNAPKKYPKKPRNADRIMSRKDKPKEYKPKEMTDDAMKTRLLAFCAAFGNK